MQASGTALKPDLTLSAGDRLEFPLPREHALARAVTTRAISAADLEVFHAAASRVRQAQNKQISVPQLNLVQSALGNSMQVIELGEVTIAEGAQLVLRDPTTSLLIKKLNLNGQIITFGHLAITARDMTARKGSVIGAIAPDGANGVDNSGSPAPVDHTNDPPPPAPPQAPNGQNANSVNGPATPGQPGFPGTPGLPGGKGLPGGNAGNGDLGGTVSMSMGVLPPYLTVLAVGGRGGNGGNAGRGGGGGQGGQGGQGGNGGDGDWFRCDASGGAGGAGGAGGNAADGGDAGNGGNGGGGGFISILYEVDLSGGTNTYNASGGQAGQPGQPGNPGTTGAGGAGGMGGFPGTGAKLTSGCPTVSTGNPGPSGAIGQPGSMGKSGIMGQAGSPGSIAVAPAPRAAAAA